jgi:hypothetical protein
VKTEPLKTFEKYQQYKGLISQRRPQVKTEEQQSRDRSIRIEGGRQWATPLSEKKDFRNSGNNNNNNNNNSNNSNSNSNNNSTSNDITPPIPQRTNLPPPTSLAVQLQSLEGLIQEKQNQKLLLQQYREKVEAGHRELQQQCLRTQTELYQLEDRIKTLEKEKNNTIGPNIINMLPRLQPEERQIINQQINRFDQIKQQLEGVSQTLCARLRHHHESIKILLAQQTDLHNQLLNIEQNLGLLLKSREDIRRRLQAEQQQPQKELMNELESLRSILGDEGFKAAQDKAFALHLSQKQQIGQPNNLQQSNTYSKLQQHLEQRKQQSTYGSPNLSLEMDYSDDDDIDKSKKPESKNSNSSSKQKSKSEQPLNSKQRNFKNQVAELVVKRLGRHRKEGKIPDKV